MSSALGTGAVIVLAVVLAVAGAAAQSAPPAAPAQRAAAGETLKERLSDKASDEQRVDNCKVPKDRRGPKPRPDTCPEANGRTAPSQ